MRKMLEIRGLIEKYKNTKYEVYYNIFMALLSFIAIVITLYSLIEGDKVFGKPIIYRMDLTILVIFNIDYWGGLALSNNRKKYFKENILDLISIIPINQSFMLFRSFKFFKILGVLRVLQVFKITSFLAKLNKSARKFLKTNGFIYSLIFTASTTGIGSTLIYMVEKGKTIDTYFDALWWTFVTTTTVGYGDISPQTGMGRGIAVVLMIVGIGFISMLTGSITTYFVNKMNEEKEQYQKDILLDKIISDIDGKDIDLSDLTDEQYAQVIMFIKFMKEQGK